MSTGNRARQGSKPDGSTLHEARERALALLYEAEIKGVDVGQVLESLPTPPQPLAVELVEGVAGRREIIDDLVSQAAVGWEIGRMPIIDRTVLRLAVFELLGRLDTPVAVIIDEAVELAKRYSTDQSGPFVNGVLSTVSKVARKETG